jgi:hypothetical protein
MPPDETMLIAALADAELLRHDLAHAEALLQAERQRADDMLQAERLRADQLVDAERRVAAELLTRIDALERRAVATEERQRELHVLLLHRDEEITRLHEYLRSSREPSAERPLALPEPAPRRPATVEQRVVAKLTADATNAAGWLGRMLARAPRRATGDRDDTR